MLETELIAILERTTDAAYSVTEEGEIRSWNRAAERLFGYSAKDVLGRHIEDVFDAFDSLGTEPLVGGADSAVRDADTSGRRIPHFDLNVRTRSGARIWINVSTIVFDNRRTGRRLLVRLARDITQHRLNAALMSQMLEVARQVVALTEETAPPAHGERLTKHERQILRLLADGKTSASIARELDVSGQTLRNHLHHINRKLGTRSRLEAVTSARRLGLLR